MSYFVEWKPAAHDRLERIWMAADDPRLILRSANAIDDILARDPWGADVIMGVENTLIVEPLAGILMWMKSTARLKFCTSG